MIGETIGHFKVVSRLGRGGMGEVFAGEHESIQTRVAIKMLHPDISENHEHVQRFFNEAKIVSRIKHAGIVKIFDVGHYNDHAYLIMELLEGEPLASRIARSTRLTWDDTVDIGRQIASVLDATHRAGVIHRDLKPDNIFLVQDHELARGERVKILDFGISKLSGTIAPGSPKTVGTMGTPAYMAPEQWGDSGSVDWRADAYSLGCVVFEMVCGRPPFEVKTIADACAKHLQAVPPRARSYVRDVPPALDDLIARLLAKEPADRAVSMGQVTRDLETIAGLPPSRSSPAIPAVAGNLLERQLAPTVLPSTNTTLGASAAELHVPPPRKRRVALLAGVGGLVVAGAIVVAVVASGGSGAKPTAAQTDGEAAAKDKRLADEAAAKEKQRLADEAAAKEKQRLADEAVAKEKQRLADELAEKRRLAEETDKVPANQRPRGIVERGKQIADDAAAAKRLADQATMKRMIDEAKQREAKRAEQRKAEEARKAAEKAGSGSGNGFGGRI